MATVTGYSPEDEGNFTRRGRGAGQFQVPGRPEDTQNFLQRFLSDPGSVFAGAFGGQQGPVITGNYDPELAAQQQQTTGGARVTGDVQQTGGGRVTTGGGGRNVGAGQSRVTMGALPNTQAMLGQNTQRAQQIMQGVGKYGRVGLAGLAVLPALGEAKSELEAGRPTGAAAALLPAGLSAAGAAMLGKGGVAGTAVGAGLMALGAILPGAAASGAESVRQKLTGEPTKGKEGDFSTQMAMAKQMGELGLSQYRTELGVETSNIKDLSKFYSDQAYYDLQRNIPLINQIKNADLVRQQSLLNTQGQINARLGVLATAGSMAQRGQEIAGQTVLTAMQTNPYAGATLQAPQIRFG